VEKLNAVGGANGVGILDIVENRLVGMKSRGVYETPGGAILYKALNVLETVTLDKESAHLKAQLAQKYADLVYNGQWFTPLRAALDAFADSLAQTVTGDVTLKLYKGNMVNAGVVSPYTLYDEQTASFGEDDDYNQADAAGFINLFGLSIAERAKLSRNWPKA
jgi:argininosuccinate synthase